MACLSSGKQGVGVYLVWPLSSAALAASLMKAGVSKSGSPAPNPTTSTPAFRSAAALALTASVIDSDTRLIRSARRNIGWLLGTVKSRNPWRRGTVAAQGGKFKRRPTTPGSRDWFASYLDRRSG